LLSKSQLPVHVQKLSVQGLRAGRARLTVDGVAVSANVVELLPFDVRGPVDLARSHASLSRVLPVELAGGRADEDALRWVVIGPNEALPRALDFDSLTPDGRVLDELRGVELNPVECPPGRGSELRCAETPLIRAVTDEVDRDHPAVRSRSVRAEIGGRIAVSIGGERVVSLRVGGPRVSAMGALGRYRAALRLHVVRAVPGGPWPIGRDATEARALVEAELTTAGAMWGQCGIHFGNRAEIELVDPPGPHLLAVGCQDALPASGGQVRFRVNEQNVAYSTVAGQTPSEVATALARKLEDAGLRASVSGNARTALGALRTADVLVRNPDGTPARVTPQLSVPVSSDATLSVCIGEVDLTRGLSHFTDFDAMAGTVAERTLSKAFEDGDPATIEVFIIPRFARTGRIGESFIRTDGSSVRNAVILDRTGMQARTRSFALAHELGHIWLDVAGHPDDFGVDTTTELMDADASDDTIFGPRRLSVRDCERAIRQSGPRAAVPLLRDWPLFALPGASGPRR
jgi:hypothetical protein